MLPKKFKLPIQDFPKNASTVLKNRFFSIKSVANNLQYNRFGVYVSSKIFKKAVLRNKTRRIFLRFYAKRANSLPIDKKGRDLLIIPKPNIIELTPREIMNNLENHGSII